MILTREEELALARRVRATGDRDARQKLVLANQRFVMKIAHAFSGYGVPFEDLLQEGNVGLVTAVDRFEPERGYRFVTYAAWWIRAMMLDYIQRSVSVVRSGANRAGRRAFFNVRGTRSRLEAELQREVTSAEVAAALGIPVADVDAMEQHVIIGDKPLDAGFIADLAATTTSPEDEVAAAEAKHVQSIELSKAMSTLDTREKLIIENRHLHEVPDSLEKIGDALHLSRERVRQIERRAFCKLQHAVAHAA